MLEEGRAIELWEEFGRLWNSFYFSWRKVLLGDYSSDLRISIRKRLDDEDRLGMNLFISVALDDDKASLFTHLSSSILASKYHQRAENAVG